MELLHIARDENPRRAVCGAEIVPPRPADEDTTLKLCVYCNMAMHDVGP